MAGILHNPKQCSQCGAPDSQFKCSCKQVYYCGAECQNKDWKQHKSKCAVILSQKVKDMKKECGKDHLAVALARMDFSKSLYEHGQFGDAEKGYLEARRIVKDVIDKHGGVMDGSVGRRGEEVVADLCGQLGALYSDTGRYDEAHKSWEESLKITRERCGERSEETAQAFQGIGSVFARQRNYKEALARTESALDIFTELGLQRSIAGTLCAKGIINRNLCQFGEAAKVMEEAREIYLKHPSTNPMGDKELATLLHSIACVYDQQGLFDKARQDFEAALELYRRLHGEKHPKVANVLFNMANAHMQSGSFDEALKLQSKSLKIRRRALGNEHETVAHTLLCMGGALLELGRFDEAKEKLEEAAGIFARRGFQDKASECADALQICQMMMGMRQL